MGKLYQSAELMQDAHKRGYGIPAYDPFNFESTKMVFEAAERANTPVIIMMYLGIDMPIDSFAEMVKSLGAKAKVPYALHLDHSPSFEACMMAIKAGFTSVMIDASKKPIDENVAETRKVVEAAHAMGIDVEGELGMVGRNEAVNRSMFTQPEEAVSFIERTGIDTLAVAIGNSHGMYIEEPELDIPLLESINKVAGKPLVLHGTSMIPVDQLKEAVRHGICKTNIATEYMMYYKQKVAELAASDKCPGTITGILSGVQGAVTDFIYEKMRVLNPDDVKIL